MSRTIINNLLCGWLACICTLLSAQPVDNSPLSRVGIGEIQDLYFPSSAAQGGLGAAYKHLHQVNLRNPASLGYLEATALETGFYAKRSALKRGEFSSNVWSGNLDYLALSFPVLNPINELLERREREFGWGVSVSLSPYSRVGYSISSQDEFNSLGVVSRNYQGDGGLYRFMLGNGWRYRDLSFGINLGALYGSTSYGAETIFNDISSDYIHIARSDISYRSFIWDAGIQYDIQLTPTEQKNKRFVTLGAYYHGKSSFDTKVDELNYVTNILFEDSDTAVYRIDQPFTGEFPSEYGIGVLIRESNVWSIGLDYSRQSWSQYRNDARPETLSDTWRIAGGLSYTPNFSSISSYLSRVEYRAGAFYQSDPRSLEGEQAYRYGVSVGAGLPFVFARTFSYLNLGLELGRAGTETSLKENYLRVRAGFVLNDNQWFLKRRYN